MRFLLPSLAQSLPMPTVCQEPPVHEADQGSGTFIDYGSDPATELCDLRQGIQPL